MLHSFSSNAITAKIKSMYGKRLTVASYEELLRMRTVEQVADYLKKETRYADVLTPIQSGNIHRGQLEDLLGQDLFNRYVVLMRYERRKNHFYEYYILSLEITQLLRCIRYLSAGHQTKFISRMPTYTQSEMRIDLAALAGVSTFKELLKVLEKTPYAKVLAPFLPDDGMAVDIPASEAALRCYYYNAIDGLIKKLYSGKTASNLRQIFETQSELINIINIYRMKHFFGLPPERIQQVLLPFSGRFPKRLRENMIAAQTTEEFLKVLEKTKYAKYIADDFTFIEYTARSIRYNLGKRFLTFSTEAPVIFASFMVLGELEISNLINIIEGIRYEVEPADIRRMLII